jgi:IPT/TIG domain
MTIISRKTSSIRNRLLRTIPLFGAAALLLAPFARPQSIASVDPSEGKVNDQVTVSGSNLGKSAVASLFLSDEKNDYKAAIVSQADDKVVIKVPSVKPGSYNVSVLAGGKIVILPVRFKVDE